MNSFNSTRDSMLIAKGSHFYCQTHLCAVPLSEQSPDLRYCRDCYNFLRNEVEVLKLNGNKHFYDWMPTDSIGKSTALNNSVGAAETNAAVSTEVAPNVTDNLPVCVICGSPVKGKRLDRRYCSPRCRKAGSRAKQLELTGVK